MNSDERLPPDAYASVRALRSEMKENRRIKRDAEQQRDLEAMRRERWQRLSAELFRQWSNVLASFDEVGRAMMRQQLRYALGLNDTEMRELEEELARGLTNQ